MPKHTMQKTLYFYPIGTFDFVETLGTMLVMSEDFMRFGIMLLSMKRTVFWDVVSCSLIEIY